MLALPVTNEDIFASSIKPHGLSISPDGAWIGMLYQRNDRYCLGLFATTSDSLLREIKLPCGRPGGLAWSPNGDAIAFFADNTDSEGTNIFILDLTSGTISALVTEPGWSAFVPSWSPDGKTIAFSAFPVPRQPPHDQPRLFTVCVATKELRQLTDGAFVDRRPDFSPDGKTLAFRRGWDIWLYDLESATERPLLSEEGHDYENHFRCFSPDGTQIAVQRNIVDGGQIIVCDIATGAKRVISETDAECLRPSWSPDGDSISFVQNREKIVLTKLDGTKLFEAAPSNKHIFAGLNTGTQWASRAEVLTFLDGNVNAWVVGPAMPAKQVTFFQEPTRVRQQPKHVEFPSTGNAQVPAILLEPEGPSPETRPAVVWLHGGPCSEAALDLELSPINNYLIALLDAGFAVLLPDYRGSTGHGQAWEWVLPEQRGVIDVDDAMAAKRFLEENGLAAKDRIALVGYSYGGYLTLMASSRNSDRWACTASLWGLINPLRMRSGWGETYDELPDLRDKSPINLLHNAKVPMLIVHGAHDSIATIDETEQSKTLVEGNGTPCELHILPDTHGLPAHTDEAIGLLIAFLQKHIS